MAETLTRVESASDACAIGPFAVDTPGGQDRVRQEATVN